MDHCTLQHYVYTSYLVTRSLTNFHTSLINTMSKLVQDIKIKKTAEYTPGKEMHSLWLAVSNMLKAIQDIKEINVPLQAVYIGVDALSQVVGLTRPPHILKKKLQKNIIQR